MTATQDANNEQGALWNGPAGRAWVDMQELLDAMFAPLERLLVEAVADARLGGRVLDVGCGTGSTTLAIARRLGGEGRCVGLDISEPMIALAQQRAARAGSTATFLQADAQRHAFTPEGFDVIASRFGVMFFDDPVAAFTNLRRATRPGGELRLLTWRSVEENPFMTTAERAAAPLLPLPPREPGGPGQFAFADPGKVTGILEGAGWGSVELRSVDVACSLPERDLLGFLSRLGPLGLALQQVDEPARAEVLRVVRAAFAPYVKEAEVRYTAACWMVSARA